MGEGEPLVLRVFTHPACPGCGAAVREAWGLGRSHPQIEVRTVSLERKEGLAEARGEKVTTLPTLILARGGEELERWVGAPEPGELVAVAARIRADTAEVERAT